MQKPTADQVQQMMAETKEAMASTKFPKGLIHPLFEDWLGAAMKHESQRTLECDWPVFKSLLQVPANEFNMEQMGFALNAIESKSQMQLDVSEGEYIQMQEYVETTCKKWIEIKASITATIKAKHKSDIIVPPKTKLYKSYGK